MRIFIVTIVILLTLAAYLYQRHESAPPLPVDSAYYEEVNRARSDFFTGLPIYSDLVTREMESALRKYRQQDHFVVAKGINPQRIMKDSDIDRYLEKGILVGIGDLDEVYFYNVQQKYRFLVPLAREAVVLVAERFNENIQKRGDLPQVKFAISSASRSAEYNMTLADRNRNVSLQSTHTYGTSFDIFYDDFYVVLPESGLVSDSARRTLGFLLGGYFRRQFHAVLFETLYQLQEEGLIYALLESNQRCYHVTPLKN